MLRFSTQVSKIMAGNLVLPILSALMLSDYVFCASLVFKTELRFRIR